MIGIYIASACFVSCLIGARLLLNNATRFLNEDEKSQLGMLMAPNNAFVFISILVIVVLFVADFLLGFAIDIDDLLTYGAAIFLVLAIISHYLVYRSLINNKYPAQYMRMYMVSSILRIMGIIEFFVIMLIL